MTAAQSCPLCGGGHSVAFNGMRCNAHANSMSSRDRANAHAWPFLITSSRKSFWLSDTADPAFNSIQSVMPRHTIITSAIPALTPRSFRILPAAGVIFLA